MLDGWRHGSRGGNAQWTQWDQVMDITIVKIVELSEELTA